MFCQKSVESIFDNASDRFFVPLNHSVRLLDYLLGLPVHFNFFYDNITFNCRFWIVRITHHIKVELLDAINFGSQSMGSQDVIILVIFIFLIVITIRLAFILKLYWSLFISLEFCLLQTALFKCFWLCWGKLDRGRSLSFQIFRFLSSFRLFWPAIF